MATDTDYDLLFESYREARQAFQRLSVKGGYVSDQELARDTDYLLLHRSGMRIALIGGEAAIRGAIQSICKSNVSGPETAKTELERFWNGMGSWQH